MTGDEWKVTIQSNVAFDLYVSETEGVNSNPNPFNYDLQFSNMTANRNFSLHASNLKYNSGFVMLIRLHAYDTIKN